MPARYFNQVGPEEFDRKPGLNPASWKYGVGWVDGPLQQNLHQTFIVSGNYAWQMDGPGAAPVASALPRSRARRLPASAPISSKPTPPTPNGA